MGKKFVLAHSLLQGEGEANVSVGEGTSHWLVRPGVTGPCRRPRREVDLVAQRFDGGEAAGAARAVECVHEVLGSGSHAVRTC